MIRQTARKAGLTLLVALKAPKKRKTFHAESMRTAAPDSYGTPSEPVILIMGITYTRIQYHPEDDLLCIRLS